MNSTPFFSEPAISSAANGDDFFEMFIRDEGETKFNELLDWCVKNSYEMRIHPRPEQLLDHLGKEIFDPLLQLFNIEFIKISKTS